MANNNKIEKDAVYTVGLYLNKCPKLDHIINTNDKTPIYDGNIYAYNDDNHKIEKYFATVPLQVKGTTSTKNYYRIARDYIEGYQKDKGCVFFLVQEKIQPAKVLYAILTPAVLDQLLQQKTKTIRIDLDVVPTDPQKFENEIFNFAAKRNEEKAANSSPKEIADLVKEFEEMREHLGEIDDKEARYELESALDQIKNLKSDDTIGWRDKFIYYSRKARDLAINNLNNPDFVKHQYIFAKYLYDWKLYYLEDYYVKLLKKSLFPSLLFFSLVTIYSLVIFYKEKADYVFGSLLPFYKEKADYVFGSLLPLSGQACVYGDMMQRGQLMAVEDIRDEFGDSVEIVYFDTASDPQNTMVSLIYANKKEIKYFVEMVGSFMAANYMNYIIEHDMFVLSGADTYYDLVEKGKGNFARILPSDTAEIHEIIKWMEMEEIKNIAILYANNDWGVDLFHSAHSSIEQSSLNLVGYFDIDLFQQSFTSIVAEMKAMNPDAVFLFLYPFDGERFLVESQRQEFTPVIYTLESPGEDMIKIAQNAAVTVRMVDPSISKEDEYYKKMAPKYMEQYKEEPTFYALKGYDAVWVMYDILKKAGTTELDSIKKFIRSGYEFSGVTGKIRFDDKGEFIVDSYDHLELIFTEEGVKTKLIQ